ncbi:hypothetical protein [Cognatishimia activa]|uniref:hypothetical protein n=1 Tax=Cognatishimia activa TaxID=1715691 RepID=UPI002230B5F1|nr:hypothetical protein [Cognatishimia activa]UZD91244.1 hypothetical protein M0D42_01120 [Cognatishimia activa]
MIRKSDDGVEHPDQHAIDDWFLYGPQNQQIEPLVRQLAVEHGMRLAEVEDVIVAALQTKLRALKP